MDTNLEMLIQMIQSQMIFVSSRIEREGNRKIYLLEMSHLLDLLNRYDHFEEAALKIQSRARVYKQEYKFKFDFFGYKRKYTELALDQVRDIINSIETRFIKGGSKSYDFWQSN